jgi:uncharacterized membrane protein YfcA
LNLRVAATFGAVAMVGTYLGARVAIFFSGAVQLFLFAIVMLAAAFFMFRGPVPVSGRTWPAAPPEVPLGPIALDAVAVGMLTGLVGVGGGFLIVPALVLLAKVPMKEAVGTSLLVIAMNSAAGFAGYRGQVVVAWDVMALFTAVAIGGIILGTRLVRLVPQHALQRAFAVVLVVMGGFILYRSRDVLRLGGGSSTGAVATAEL